MWVWGAYLHAKGAHSDTTARDACARELTSFRWMLLYHRRIGSGTVNLILCLFNSEFVCACPVAFFLG